MADDRQAVSVDPQEAARQVVGSTFRPVHLDLEENVYPVSESRLKTFGLLNVLVPFFFSLGSGVLAFGFGIQADMSLSPGTAEAARLASIAFEVSIVLAVLFFLAAGFFVWKRESDFQEIKRIAEALRQAKQPTPPTPHTSCNLPSKAL